MHSKVRHLMLVLIVLGWILAAPLVAAPPKLNVVAPSAAGMDAGRLAFIDRAVEDEIAAKKLPGCVVLVGRQGRIAFLKAYGNRQL